MRIRHIAVVVTDPEKSAEFYADVLNFKRLGSRKTGSFPGQAVDLTDGEVHFSLVNPSDDSPRQNWSHGTYGTNHIGVEIEDFDEAKQRLEVRGIETFGAKYVDGDPTKPMKYFKFCDPDGIEVDVSRSADADTFAH